MILTFGAERQWGGNAGYDDDATTRYRYDNFVPNHKRIATGHLALIRDRKGLIGMARIGSISATAGEKTRFRCSVPGCGLVQIKRRASRSPAFRCAEGHEFDTPLQDAVACTAFEAELEEFVPAPGALSFEQMRAACVRFNPQNAMQPIDLEAVLGLLLAANPDVQRLIGGIAAVPPSPVAVERAAQDDPAVWERVARRIRRGQGRFRQGLVDAYEGRCALTGHGPDSVLEAAHIASHATTGRNAQSNGLLLRADLHALFDDELIAIDPDTGAVRVHASLLGTPYADLQGRVVRPRKGGGQPDADALRTRWERFGKEP